MVSPAGRQAAGWLARVAGQVDLDADRLARDQLGQPAKLIHHGLKLAEEHLAVIRLAAGDAHRRRGFRPGGPERGNSQGGSGARRRQPAGNLGDCDTVPWFFSVVGEEIKPDAISRAELYDERLPRDYARWREMSIIFSCEHIIEEILTVSRRTNWIDDSNPRIRCSV